jgi:tRNA (guanine37-N1)-methyltransferase
MNVSIISLFPELYTSFMGTSLVKRAHEKNHITCAVDSLFSFAQPKERVDGPAFGPGAGMVIRPEVVERAVDRVDQRYGASYKIFFSPHGRVLDQSLVEQIYADVVAHNQHIAFFPARYEGMDARIESHYADQVISIGNFVLMGGDIPTMMFLEAFLRQIPGVVAKEESVLQDSFAGPFVDYPAYTAPVEWKGMHVPDVLRSGHHGKIEQWRELQAIRRTLEYHFRWLAKYSLTTRQKEVVQESIPHYYVALMHTDVKLSGGRTGETSVTSIDIHDIARTARTYNMQRFFIVTPLRDQQHIVNTLLEFWTSGPGVAYNSDRVEAIKQVVLQSDLDGAIDSITTLEGVAPRVIGTSACLVEEIEELGYSEHRALWQSTRPVLLLLGTGQGLSSNVLQQCDYILPPLEGISDYNHLSVRSAAAIICDRLLGINKR